MTEKWCETCGDRSDRNCGNERCPIGNAVVDTGDELHQILAEALRRALSSPHRGSSDLGNTTTD